MLRTLPEGQFLRSVVAGLLHTSARYVKAFGTLGADAWRAPQNRQPPHVLRHNNDTAATTMEDS